MYIVAVRALLGLAPSSSFRIPLTDDGSRDRTFPLTQAIAERDPCVRMVKLKRKYSQTAAITTCQKVFQMALYSKRLQQTPEPKSSNIPQSLHELSMKIWIIFQDAVPPSHNGVMRPYFLARQLAKRGHDVTIIASNFNHRSRRHLVFREGELIRQEVHEGVRFLWLRVPGYRGNTAGRFWNMLVFAYRVLAATATRLPQPEIILGSSPSPIAAWAAERVARRLGVPFVLEVRDLWPETLIDIGDFSPWHPLVIFLRWLEHYLYRSADRIVSVLPNARSYMAARGADPAKIDLIPNGVELERFPPPQPPTGGDRFTVIYAGAHGRANSLDTILDAATLLQQDPCASSIRFRFIGDGADKERLEQRIKRQHLANVKFEDGVSNSEIYGILAQADGFIINMRNVSLYKYGVSPNKIFEYMAMARPVVVASSAFNNPIAKAEAGLVVPADDAAALAKAVATLASMPAAERWKMGLRGRRYVEEHHSFDKLAAELEQTLVLACPLRSGPP